MVEDFAPFCVDITTQEPDLEAFRKSGTLTFKAGQVSDLVEVERDSPASQRGFESSETRHDLVAPHAAITEEGTVDVTVVDQATRSTETSSPSIGAERSASARSSDVAFAQLDRLMTALS